MTDINYTEFKELFDQLDVIVKSVDYAEVKHAKIFSSKLREDLCLAGLIDYKPTPSSDLGEIAEFYSICQKKMAYLAEMY